jgi:hypothetical protein
MIFGELLKIDPEYKDCEYLNVKIKDTNRKITLFSKYSFDYFDTWVDVYKRIKPYNHFLSGDVILFNKFKIMFPIFHGTIIGIIVFGLLSILQTIIGFPFEMIAVIMSMIAVASSLYATMI